MVVPSHLTGQHISRSGLSLAQLFAGFSESARWLDVCELVGCDHFDVPAPPLSLPDRIASL
jgi:hypothetical protein